MSCFSNIVIRFPKLSVWCNVAYKSDIFFSQTCTRLVYKSSIYHPFIFWINLKFHIKTEKLPRNLDHTINCNLTYKQVDGDWRISEAVLTK